MGTGVGEQDELEGVGEQDEPSDCHADMSPVEEKGQRKNWVARASDSRAAPRGLLHGTTRVGTRPLPDLSLPGLPRKCIPKALPPGAVSYLLFSRRAEGRPMAAT